MFGNGTYGSEVDDILIVEFWFNNVDVSSSTLYLHLTFFLLSSSLPISHHHRKNVASEKQTIDCVDTGS